MKRAICALWLVAAGFALPAQAQEGQAPIQTFQFVLPSFSADWFVTVFNPPDFSVLRQKIIQPNTDTASFPGWATWLATLPPRTQAIANILADAGTTGGAEARAGIVDLLAKAPGDAQAYTATLIEIGANGISPFFDANDSQTTLLAEALATQVAAWQALASTSPAAAAALAGVNAAFAAANLSAGSAFAIAFTAQLNQLGGVLLPPALALPGSPLAVVIPFIPGDETAMFSPN